MHSALARGLTRLRLASAFAVAFSLIFLSGCHVLHPVDTTPLDAVGMDYASIQTLKSLHISTAEVTEVAKARQAGLSDDGCVKLVQIARSRNETFHFGEDVGQLLRAGMAEPTILQLARLDQLGLWTGEAQAMRLAGLSDQIILEVARRHAAKQSVLSGASLANLKNAGLSSSFLMKLVLRGVGDSDVSTIVRLRRRGMSESQILRHFSPASSTN